MKKILSILIVFLSLAASTPTYSFEVDGLRFFPEQNGHSVSLIGDKNIIGEIVIPETVEYEGKTYTVTSIGSRAFSECTGLTSVTIPKSVTSIDDGAFYGCTGLTKVEIPNSVKSIGQSAFMGCTGLTQVDIPKSVKSIDSFNFAGCTGLTQVDIPNSVTSIGEYAFYGCTGLTQVYVPNSVTSIGFYAFSDCTSLTRVNIPNTITEIGFLAFSGCTSLDTINSMILEPQNVNYSFFPKTFIFKNVNKNNCLINIPAGSIKLYKSTSPWWAFANIVENEECGNIQTSIAYDQSVTNPIQLPQQENLKSKRDKLIEEAELMLQNPEGLTDSANYNKILELANSIISYIYGRFEYDKLAHYGITLYKAAVAIHKKHDIPGEKHFGVANIYLHTKVGKMYYYNKDYKNAKDYLEAVYEYKKAQAEYDPDIEYKIGVCYYHLGKIDVAKKHFENVVNTINPGILVVVESYEMLGRCYLAEKDTIKASDNFFNALNIRNYEDIPLYDRKQLCEDFCQYGLSQDDCSLVYRFIRKTIDDDNKEALHVFQSSTSASRRKYWEEYSNLFQSNYPAITLEAYNYKQEGLEIDYDNLIGHLYDKSALFAKGLLLTSENELSRVILGSKNQNLIDRFHELQVMRSELNYMRNSGLSEQSEEFITHKKDITTLEEDIFEVVKEYDDFTRNLTITWDSVQSNLGPKDIAIEFLSFPRVGTDKVVYAALIVRNMRNNDEYKQPHMTVLFEESKLQAMAGTAYNSAELSDSIWGKLARKGELNNVENIYFSPSGLLHTIPIESLPHWDGSGKLITDSSYGLHFYRLSSTRELAMRRTPVANSDTVTASVYGGILYKTPKELLPLRRDGRENTAMEELSDKEQIYLPSTEFINQINESDFAYANSRAVEIRHYEDGRPYIFWKPLKGSRIEADSIVSLFSNKGIQIQNDYYNESSATETSFKNLAGQKKRIIHISTHGFYWNDSTAREIYKELPISFMDSDNDNLSPEDQAMSRCGLLFSGAQHIFDGDSIQSDKDDCVLTAQEVSQLDLRGLELLVLSACQTGLGEIGGDGVFGLQRGFKKAGAQSIIMSLWEVNDLATRDMMIKFYEYLNPDLSNKQEAFLKAQEDVRNNDKNYTYDEKDPVNDARLRATRPHWAAFILLDAL